MEIKYQIKFAGQVVNEATLSEIRVMLERGQVGSLHKLSSDGQTWRYVSEMPELTADSGMQVGDALSNEAPAAAEVVEACPQPESRQPQARQAPEGNWLALIRNIEYGPYTDEQMADLVVRKRIAIGDYVWKDGWSDWRVAEEVFPEAQPRKRPGDGVLALAKFLLGVITFIPRKMGALFYWCWTRRKRVGVPIEQQQLSILAVSSVALALLWGFGLTSVAAILCGLLALQDIFTSKGHTWGARFAFFGVATGGLGLFAAIYIFFLL